MAQRMPAVFFGHGNPMNAITRNRYSEAWAQIGRSVPRPRAVVMVSAHWYIPAIAVTASPAPETVYDFHGFPRELYQVRYSAPGNSEIVDQICGLLAPHQVEHDQNWGFDHGTWSVLCHVFPDASVPVVQLSVARTLTPQAHYELGRMLAPLRDQGVLVAGSGNIVHNLREYAWGQEDAAPFPWAVSFEHKIRDALLRGDVSTLTGYASLGDDARRSVPTPEHYLPLLHVAGTRDPSDAVTFPVEGIDGGSISMLSVRIG